MRETPVVLVKINAGATYSDSIYPVSPGGFPEGSYRLVLVFAATPEGFRSQQTMLVSSAPLQVH
jgi:hypothetical protein